MRALAFAGFLLLAACGSDVRDTKIADIDFTSPASIQGVAQRLEPAERAAFVYYVTRRTMAGGFGVKELVAPSGKAPATVRDAIALATVAQKRDGERGKLMDERNKLVERYNGMDINDNPTEYHRLGNEIGVYDKRIAATDVAR